MEETIEKFEAATQDAFEGASSQVILVGAANGAVVGSFLMCYLPLILYGGSMIYNSVRETGCDPSGTIEDNTDCSAKASILFGATMGLTFGGAAIPQVLGALRAFSSARAAVHPAIVVMSRKFTNDGNESPEEAVVVQEKESSFQRRRGRRSPSIVANLPEYSIDSSSTLGSRLKAVKGTIEFRNVDFSYPTRKERKILNGFSLTIPSGKTVALVGPSGGGKSTIVSLIQRFYDPMNGSVLMDGEDLKDLNVPWLRQQIGIVAQEPKLFAQSIRDNIKIAHPEATQEEVEDAAKRANAHDFILSFPDGYDTHVGHEGAQLSGGM